MIVTLPIISLLMLNLDLWVLCEKELTLRDRLEWQIHLKPRLKLGSLWLIWGRSESFAHARVMLAVTTQSTVVGAIWGPP